jgi:hypothetical protein
MLSLPDLLCVSNEFAKASRKKPTMFGRGGAGAKDEGEITPLPRLTAKGKHVNQRTVAVKQRSATSARPSEIISCPMCGCALRKKSLKEHKRRVHRRRRRDGLPSGNIPSSFRWMRLNEMRGTGMNTSAVRTRRRSPP